MPEHEGPDVVDEEILDGKGDSETSEESSAEKTESQPKAGEAEKTEDTGGSAEGAEADDLAGLKEGQSIPYERFKKVIEERNKLRTDHESVQAELEEAQGYIKNPDVFRAILLSRGITDKKAQDERLREAGFEVKESKVEGDVYKNITSDLDLNTQEGWLKAMERAVKTFGKDLIDPIQRKLFEREANEWISQQETEAKKLSKELYNIEFGQVGRDERNPNTGVGKIWSYLQKHPEDAKLGHVKLLRLAMSEEGFKLGKEKGFEEARERNENLKRSAMEAETGETREREPDGTWSVHDLMEYARRHK
jgi:hypothetical protein